MVMVNYTHIHKGYFSGTLGSLYDCPSACEVALKDMSESIR